MVANQTVTATIILIVAPVTANASGPYANQPKYQVVDTQTEYNSLPPEVTIPLVGADGSALASVLTTGADGSPSGTYM